MLHFCLPAIANIKINLATYINIHIYILYQNERILTVSSASTGLKTTRQTTSTETRITTLEEIEIEMAMASN